MTQRNWQSIIHQTNGGIESPDFLAAMESLEADVAAGGSSPLTTKGDLYSFGTGNARLAVGAQGYYLHGDSTQTLGLGWGRPFSVIDVMAEYGAKGDGTTDDSTAIQNAINDAVADIVPVFFPLPGSGGGYYLATGLTSTSAHLVMVGAGGSGQSRALGRPGCRFLVGSGQVGFTFAPTTLQFQGPILRELAFIDNTPGSGVGGLLIEQAVNAKLLDCYASDFTAGYGISFSPPSTGAQYSEIRNPIVSNCQQGIVVAKTNGVEVFGGLIDQDNGGSVVTGTTGIVVESGDTLRAFGTRIQYCEVGIDAQDGSSGAEFYGVRLEGCTTLVRIGGDNVGVYGGAFNNFVVGGGGTAFAVLSTADSAILQPNHASSVGTYLSDAGTNTQASVEALGYTGNRTNILAAAVTMTTALTIYDGPSLTLEAGSTWKLDGAIELTATSTSSRFWSVQLWDGTTIFAGADHQTEGTAANAQTGFPVSAVVTPAVTTTYKISATTSVGGDRIGIGTTGKASYLNAVKVG